MTCYPCGMRDWFYLYGASLLALLLLWIAVAPSPAAAASGERAAVQQQARLLSIHSIGPATPEPAAAPAGDPADLEWLVVHAAGRFVPTSAVSPSLAVSGRRRLGRFQPLPLRARGPPLPTRS